MTVECIAVLPHGNSMEEIGEVISILLGGKKELLPLGGKADRTYLKVSGYKFHCIEHIPGSGWLLLNNDRKVTFILDCKEGIMLRRGSHAEAIALFTRLVEIFGGKVDYNDADEIDIDFQHVSPPFDTNPEDGEPWHFWKNFKYNLEPMSQEYIASFEVFE